MNLTQPPFDDIHVRKAMNYIMDKDGPAEGLGRPARRVDRHAHRPGPMLYGDRLSDYNPYATPNDAGSSRRPQPR